MEIKYIYIVSLKIKLKSNKFIQLAKLTSLCPSVSFKPIFVYFAIVLHMLALLVVVLICLAIGNLFNLIVFIENKSNYYMLLLP